MFTAGPRVDSLASMTGAAFFDLDRTLLPKASGPALSAAMRQTGVVSARMPGEALLFGYFNLLGESLGSIALARQAVLVAKGKPADAFDDAAQLAADVLEPMVGPFARMLIDEHHAAGRPVVLATTTPEHLVRPLAARLGIDHVIATRYEVGDDGRFTGRNDGHFVWSMGKIAAVRDFAEEEGIDLDASFAYSDSITDLPMLEAVGHPTAVNADRNLHKEAAARGWPILTFSNPVSLRARFQAPSSTTVTPGAATRLPIMPLKTELPFLWKSPSKPWPMASCSSTPGQPAPRTTSISPAGQSTASRLVVA